jgi:hypothetical protein
MGREMLKALLFVICFYIGVTIGVLSTLLYFFGGDLAFYFVGPVASLIDSSVHYTASLIVQIPALFVNPPLLVGFLAGLVSALILWLVCWCAINICYSFILCVSRLVEYLVAIKSRHKTNLPVVSVIRTGSMILRGYFKADHKCCHIRPIKPDLL